ncbi:hypothetical protein EVAR_3681_1 [Eumeta japonica]|uniref:RNA-directed DNA polymerase from mobile element jockey n=1 Tax=Eumeta variegata TaxID=151549 RepID=A0A4C1SRI2_EUMVA|nr:hypothetical protein EVAR_3681_1 [Eumeta japonica]
MKTHTRLEEGKEREYLKAPRSLPFCTPCTLMIYHDRRQASSSRYSQTIPPGYARSNRTQYLPSPPEDHRGSWLDGSKSGGSRNLHFRDHIKRVRKTAIFYQARLNAMLGRNSKLSLHNKRTLYLTCIRTVLTYASPVFAHAALNTLEKLQVLQNKFCRAATNAHCDLPWGDLLEISPRQVTRRQHTRVLTARTVKLNRIPANSVAEPVMFSQERALSCKTCAGAAGERQLAEMMNDDASRPSPDLDDDNIISS